MGTLYVVATPIGNMEDITLRALRVLAEVAVIAAEDTRTTRNLLQRHGVRAKLVALTEHNTARALPSLLATLESADVAVVSEAGTPAISDPGYELVTAAIAAGHQISPIPGPSAVLAALVVSGLPAREFTYLGFLPHAPGERRRVLTGLAKEPRTVLFFESPHRVRGALADLLTACGNRRLAVCRELTKLYEEVFRGTVEEALAHFETPRGEFTIVIEGASDPGPPDEEEALRELARLKRGGMHARDASAEVSRRTGVPRRRLYDAWQTLDGR